jgi:hypothetical protein
MKQVLPVRSRRLWLYASICLLFFSFQGSKLAAQCTSPGVSIATPGIITCGSRTITLNGSSPTVGASFVWSGPSGFNSFSSNPSVSIPGTYILTVMSPVGNCTSVDSVKVLQDIVQPDAHTSVSDVMSCAKPVITVSAISTTPGVTYRWIGPGTFTSTLQNLSVTTAGGYTLMVIGQNGCISTATAYVDKNVQLPTASAYVSGNLTCLVNTVQLTSSSATSGVSYSWAGPGFSTPVNLQNTPTTVDGLYTVTTTNPVNGCQSTASVNVVKDVANPVANITASSNIITCAVTSASLLGSSPTVGVSYSWTGPSLSRTTQNVTVAKAGTYTLTVKSSQNGCTSSTSKVITVDKTYPDALATVSSTINCKTSIVTLQGSSNTSGVNYIWYGPDAFGTLSGQTQTTAYPGGYILGVSNQANGCITTTAVDVWQDIQQPVSVTATTNGTITCAQTSVTLTGSSATTNATYSWSGPNGTSFTGTNPTVSLAGNYVLTAQDPANGCTASTTTVVSQNKTKPNAVAANNGPFTCLLNSVTLSGSSTTGGVTYQWKNGNGTIIASTQNTAVNTSDLYSLVVTDPSNGCFNNSVTFVDVNTTKPELVSASNGGPLNCALSTIRIDASSATAGVSYSWTGPGSFTSTAKNPTVSTPGTYTVTIKNTQNGCTDNASTLLTQDITLPGVSVATAPTITCANTSVIISASSSTPGVTYSWTGPIAFSSSEANPTTNKMGNYTVTVTNPVNSCTSSANLTVAKDTIAPAGVTASAPNAITCTALQVALAAASTDNVTYSWSGPRGFTSSSQTPTVSLVGNYMVTATKTSNGCTSFANTTVVKDTIVPANVNAVASGILNCVNANVTLTGSSLTPGVAYSWTGPGLGASTTTQNVTTNAVGVYNLKVTNTTNGCFATASVTVDQDHTVPGSVLASSGPTLTCSAPNTTVTASATGDVIYSWVGPNSFVANAAIASVNKPGTYTVTVTEQNSKCFVTATAIVTQDTLAPKGIQSSYSDVYSCYTPEVTLTGQSSTTGVTFNWTGPNNYIQQNMAMPVVTFPGDYTLTVINPVNGCFRVSTLTLPADTAPPANVVTSATFSGKLTCLVLSLTLSASSSSSNVDYEWDDSNGNPITNSPNAPVNKAGNYIVIATNSENGCSVTKTATVASDKVIPTVILDVTNNSTVLQQSTNIINATNVASYAYTWSLTNWTALSGQLTPSFTYQSGNTGSTSKITLGLKNNNNGCVNTYVVNLSAVALKSALVEEESVATVEPVSMVSLNTYPTPAIGKVSVEISSPEPTDATVTVYNFSGAVVATLFSSTMSANQTYKLTFNDNAALPSGIYFCKLKTKTKTITNKILLQ